MHDQPKTEHKFPSTGSHPLEIRVDLTHEAGQQCAAKSSPGGDLMCRKVARSQNRFAAPEACFRKSRDGALSRSLMEAQPSIVAAPAPPIACEADFSDTAHEQIAALGPGKAKGDIGLSPRKAQHL